MKTKSRKHGFRRLLCGLTALAAALVMLPASALAGQNSGPAVVQNGVTIDKGATNLDENDQTRVTLEIGSVQTNPPDSDVVFVLDKSTSAAVRNEAKAMLDELKAKANDNVTISVGVVSFNRNGNEVLALTPLTDDNYSNICNALDNTPSGGTNIQAGIEKGIEVLSRGSADAENKYLVLVSDGITYLWGTDENPLTVYNESNNSAYMTGPDDAATYWPQFDRAFLQAHDMAAWLNQAAQNNIESIRDTYQMHAWLNESGSAPSYPPAGYVTKFIEWGSDIPYTANEIGIYQAGRAWEKAANNGYNLYSYASLAKQAGYPWGVDFMMGLATIGDTYTKTFTDDAANVDGMFDSIQNAILYEIQSGTVTDTIGNDFNWVGMDTLQLTVGGQAYTGTVTGNTVTYDVNLDGVAEYEVTYANNNGVETLTWDINVPVEAARGVTLSYALKVDPNSPTLPAAGTSGYLPTNVEAVLTYKPTDGTYRDEMEFPIPELPYGTPGGETSGDDDEEEEPDPDPVLPTTPTISIRKVWVEDTEAARPDSILVEIYHEEELYDTIEIEEKYNWRASYNIPARYENDDWWVEEADVPAYYDSSVEETRDNVFVITNTYDEPEVVIEESSEPSEPAPEPSQPSEYIPEPSEEPSSEPAPEPQPEPAEPSEPTLPQTGQLWWPVPVLLLCGAVAVASGALRSARRNRK